MVEKICWVFYLLLGSQRPVL